MDKTTFKPRMPLGRLDRDLLERMAQVVREYDIPVVRATAGQRLLLAGIRPGDWDAVAAALGMHFEERAEAQTGKAMVLGMSRDICVHLYDEIVKQRPGWHSTDPRRARSRS